MISEGGGMNRLKELLHRSLQKFGCVLNLSFLKGIFICSFLIVNSLSYAYAGVKAISIDEAFVNADFIIRGVVRDSQSHWDEKRIMIFTDYTIEVLEELKGNSPSQIEMSFAGGKVGNKSILVTDVPTLKIGEEYIICAYEKEKKYSVPVVGGYQGIFRFIRDEMKGIELVVDYYGYQLEAIDNKIIKGLPLKKEADGSVKALEEVRTEKKEITEKPIIRDAHGNTIIPENHEFAKPKVREKGRAIIKTEFIDLIRNKMK